MAYDSDICPYKPQPDILKSSGGDLSSGMGSDNFGVSHPVL